MPTPAPASSARPHLRARRLRATLVLAATTLSLIAVPQLVPDASASAPSAAQVATIKSNMLKVLNAERRAHGVAAVRMNSHLVLSAHRHDVRMARTNTMSHRLSG